MINTAGLLVFLACFSYLQRVRLAKRSHPSETHPSEMKAVTAAHALRSKNARAERLQSLSNFGESLAVSCAPRARAQGSIFLIGVIAHNWSKLDVLRVGVAFAIAGDRRQCQNEMA